MGQKILNILYYIFFWLIFPVLLSIPVMANIEYYAMPSQLNYSKTSLMELHYSILSNYSQPRISEYIQAPLYFVYLYILGLLPILIISAICRMFKIKNKKMKVVFVIVIVILGWISWPARWYFTY